MIIGNARWGQDNLNPDYDEAFVDYLTEVVKHYQECWDLHFNYIAPFNEPVEGWWNIDKKKKTAQEGCNFSASSIKRVFNLASCTFMCVCLCCDRVQVVGSRMCA